MTLLASNLGGTRMKIGVVRDGVVLGQCTQPSNSKAGLAPGLPVLKAPWLRLLAGLNISTKECAGISVPFPSLIDTQSGRVLVGELGDQAALVAGEWLLPEQFPNCK
jgi:glucokinase